MFETLLGNNPNKLIIEEPPVIEEEPVDTVPYGKVAGQSGDHFGLNIDIDKTGSDIAVFSARNGGTVHYLKRENNNYVEKQVLTIGGMITDITKLFRTHREPTSISPDGKVLVVLKNQASPASILVYKKNQQGLWSYSQEITGMKANDMTSCDTSEDGTWLFVSLAVSKVLVFKMGADGKYTQYQEVSRTGIARKVYCSDSGDRFIATSGQGGTGNSAANIHVFIKNQNGEFINTQSLKDLLGGYSLGSYVFNGIKISGDGSTIFGGSPKKTVNNEIFVFKLNPQTNQYYLFKTIMSSNPTSNFGAFFDVSYSGNTVIVGDPGWGVGDKSGEYSQTLVYKLINGAYVQTNTVTGDDRTGNDEHGMCVRISRNSRMCVTVAPAEDVNGTNSGSIYSFGI